MSIQLPISAFIITLNEENNIRECLNSLSFCDEIIVIDSGSSDLTCKIATELGAKVIFNAFNGYTDQKQFALDQCTNEWVLSLDADERISEKLADFIINKFSSLNERTEINGYEFKRLHYFMGSFIRHSGLYPDYKLRFFRKSKGYIAGENIHEVVKVEGQSQKIPLNLIHYSWINLQDFFSKQIKYAQKVALNKHFAGKQTNIIDILLRACFSFIYRFFIRLGFLDGFNGLVLCLGAGIFTFYKYCWLHYLNKFYYGKSRFLTSFIFKPLQNFYLWGHNFRLWLYDQKILKRNKLSIPVISVGNLSVGGAGKTPFVIWLSKQISKQFNLANISVLSRGYKNVSAKYSKTKPLIVNLQTEKAIDLYGDEPVLMAESLIEENINIITCQERYLAGLIAQNELFSPLAILDDGFQHIQLERDLNICLIDCSDIDFKYTLPCGSRRESLSEFKRADIFVLTRVKQNPLIYQKYINLLKNLHPSKKIYWLDEQISKFTLGLSPVEEYLTEKKVLAFCGLGNSAQFFRSLEAKGLKLQKTIIFPDHYHYKTLDKDKLLAEMKNSESQYLITTLKDGVKLKDFDFENKLRIAHLEIQGLKSTENDINVELNNLLGSVIFDSLTSCREAQEID